MRIERSSMPVTIPHGDILKLSDRERQVIQRRVESQDGSVRCFIHPFFSESELDSTKLSAYYNLLEAVLAANPSLIFLGEESTKVSHTLLRFQKAGFDGPVIYYETCENDPQPLKTNWRDLALSMNKMGVRHLLTGGMYSRIVYGKNNCENILPHLYRSDRASLQLGGCVGGFVHHMNKYGIPCTVSAASFPSNIVRPHVVYWDNAS